MIVVMDLMTKKGLEDKRPLFIRCNCRTVFDSLMSPNLYILDKIGITVHKLIKPVRIRFHIDDGLPEVVQHTMQLQMIWHVK